MAMRANYSGTFEPADILDQVRHLSAYDRRVAVMGWAAVRLALLYKRALASGVVSPGESHSGAALVERLLERGW